MNTIQVIGSAGTGKSSVMCAIITRLKDRRVNVNVHPIDGIMELYKVFNTIDNRLHQMNERGIKIRVVENDNFETPDSSEIIVNVKGTDKDKSKIVEIVQKTVDSIFDVSVNKPLDDLPYCVCDLDIYEKQSLRKSA